MASGAVVAVTLQTADLGDTTTVHETLKQAQANAALINARGVEEAVLDKGYHSGEVLINLHQDGVRSYIPEPDRGKRNWGGKELEKKRVEANRRRTQGERGKALQRLRSEHVERSFAHMYETGGMRRTHLRGHENILKRQLVHVGAFNLSLILRQLLGAGTPRQWKDLEGTPFLLFIYYLLVGKIEIGSPEEESQYLVRNRPQNHEARLAARRRWSCRKLVTSTPGC